jgi:hypothetical protein
VQDLALWALDGLDAAKRVFNLRAEAQAELAAAAASEPL